MVEAFKEKPEVSTTVDRVVASMRQAMFEGMLPPGTQLREEMLSRRFEVSRSSVREALRVLTMDGLVQRRPNHTVVVRHLTVADVEDIYRARLLLEGSCVRAVATCSDRDLRELARELKTYAAEVRTSDHPRAAEAHITFHANMVRLLSGSRWLAETERSMLRHLLLILATVHMSSEDLRQEIRRHRDLVDLCTARNIDEALVCLKDGLEESRAFAIKFTFEALEQAHSKSPDAWLER